MPAERCEVTAAGSSGGAIRLRETVKLSTETPNRIVGGLQITSAWGAELKYTDNFVVLKTLFGLHKLSMIEKGSQGSVYRFIDESNKPYAIKIIKDGESSPKDIKEKRGDLCALLLPTHSNIATTHALILQSADNKTIIPISSKEDIPAQSDSRYRVKIVISEYVDGFDLNDVINPAIDWVSTDQGPKLAIRTAKQLVEALEHFHTNNLLYRDLKPSNIMITTTGKIKVVDFGLVKYVERLTRSQSCVGSLMYWSPEISRDTDIKLYDKFKRQGHTGQTDLWGLGITLMVLMLATTIDYLWDGYQGSKYPDLDRPADRGESSFSCWFAKMDEAEKRDLLLEVLEEEIDRTTYSEAQRDHLINIIIGLTKENPDERMPLSKVREQLDLADPP